MALTPSNAAVVGGRVRGILFASLAIVVGLTAMGLPALRDVMALSHLGEGPSPYFIPEHALLLYVVMPLATLATGAFFLAPGLILANSFGSRKGVAAWLLSGFALSMAVLVPAVVAFQLVTGIVAQGTTFFYLVLAFICLATLVANLRSLAGEPDRLTLGEDAADLVVAPLLAMGVLVLLAPKFYWETFTGDGAEALEWSRLFIHTLWPFWPEEAGAVSDAPGLTSILTMPVSSWFVRLWGDWEMAARAPLLLFLALLYPVLTALIRHGRQVRFAAQDHAILCATLFVYALTAIYSGGYNPYFGDSPMPAARETLALALFMGYVLAFVQDRPRLMVATGLMAHMTIPTGGLWLLMLPVAVALVWRPLPVRQLRWAGVTLVLAAVLSLAGPLVIGLTGLPYPDKGEFGVAAIVDRLRFVALTDVQRIAFLAVPCGILPVLFLFAWRSHDRLARVLTLMTAAYFLFFYLQGYRVLPHHFIPAMAAPLVVFWRSPWLSGPQGQWVRHGAVLCLLAALSLAWPKEFRLHAYDRIVGHHVQTLGPRFAADPSRPGERPFNPAAYDTTHELLAALFPVGWTDEEARTRYFGSPLVWWYYAERPRPVGIGPNYVIRPLTDTPREPGRLFAEHDGYGLFIRDLALYEAHRTMRLPTDTGAPVFVTPREEMFGRGARWDHRVVIDLVAVARWIIGANDHRAARPGA